MHRYAQQAMKIDPKHYLYISCVFVVLTVYLGGTEILELDSE